MRWRPYLADAAGLALLSASVAGAAAGFLPHNWAPARVFLGDAGSVPLGFLAGVLGVAGWTAGAWPAWFPLLVFSPFVVDASVTLLRRALRGERVWHAHREHLYQRMVRSGLGHGRTAALWYAGDGCGGGLGAGGIVVAEQRPIRASAGMDRALRYGVRPDLAPGTSTGPMNRPFARLFATLMSPRSALVLLFDLGAVAAAWLLAYALRFNLDVPHEYVVAALRALVWVLPVYGVVFLLSGLYRGVWRFASLPDMLRIARAVAMGGAGVALGAYLLQMELAPPRSVIVLAPLLLALIMGGARAAYRAWREEQHRNRVTGQSQTGAAARRRGAGGRARA